AVSNTGMLVYRVGGSATQRVLRWFDRSGKLVGAAGVAGPYRNAALSPTGDRLAEARVEGAKGDLWTMDLQRGASSRFTFDPGVADNPVWSPDGNRIVFGSARGGGDVLDLYVKDAGGAGEPELLLKTNFSKYPTDWSRDGHYIVYTEVKGSAD